MDRAKDLANKFWANCHVKKKASVSHKHSKILVIQHNNLRQLVQDAFISGYESGAEPPDLEEEGEYASCGNEDELCPEPEEEWEDVP